MRRSLRWVLVAVGGLLLLAVATLVALPYLIDLPRVRAYVAQAASQALGRPVRFGSLSVSALPLPAVRLRALEVADDPRFGTRPIVSAREVRIGIRVLPLLTGRVELADVTLDGVRLEVVDESGRLNVALLGPAAAASRPAPRPGGPGPAPEVPAGLAVRRMRITDGQVRYARREDPGRAFVLRGITLDVEAGATGESLRISGRALGSPGDVALRLADGSVELGAGRPVGEVGIKAVVDVEVPDLGPLGALLVAAPTLSGSARGRLTVGGTLLRPRATGEVRLERLLLAQDRPQCPAPTLRQLEIRDLRVPLAYDGQRVEGQPVQGRVAGGIVTGRVVYAFAPSPLVTLTGVQVQGLELSRVLVDYLCQSLAVTGPLELTGAATARPEDPLRTLTGSARVRVGAGKVVGADAVQLLSVVLKLGGAASALLRGDPRALVPADALEFDSITATVSVVNGMATTRDLAFAGRRLTLGGSGSYGLADGRVDASLTVTEGRTQVSARVAGVVPGRLSVVPTGVSHGGRDVIKRALERLFR